MKRIILALAVFGLILSFGAAEAMAIGLGLGVQSGSGTMDIELDGVSYGEYDFDTSDLGLVLDTNLSQDSTFNYRLTLASANPDLGFADFGDESGFTMVHDFGFGIIKEDSLRLWMGPELRLSWYSGTGDGFMEADLFSFGLGVVLGANFHVGETLTIAVTGAYLSQTTNGDVWDYFGSYYDWSSSDDLTIIGVNLMFRLNEGYF